MVRSPIIENAIEFALLNCERSMDVDGGISEAAHFVASSRGVLQQHIDARWERRSSRRLLAS